jgi:hypothetical protein
VTPTVFVVGAGLLVLNTLLDQPMRAGVGLGVVLLGTPAFFLWRARSRRGPEAIADRLVAVPVPPRSPE